MLRAFPRTGRGWLDRGVGASLGNLLRQFPPSAQVLRIGQLTSSSQSFSPLTGELAVLLGKVAFSPKREGYLMLQEDDRSNPIALPVRLRRPELLNALVVVDDWAAVPTVNWPEDGMVVDPPTTPKRQRTSKKFYIECKSIRVLATATDAHYGNAGGCQGMIIGMSAVFRDDHGAEYWVIELASDVCVVCFGNQALRHVLCVGSTYQFSNCTSKRLGLGGGLVLQAYVCVADELKVCLLEDDLPFVPLTTSTTTPQVNLFHYEGRVTAHPAAFVLELDGKFKVFLHQLPKVYLWFGLRVGCLVRFRALCQVSLGHEMLGFESTWRTEMDVVEFASHREPQIRFPHTNTRYQHIATLHLHFALDLVAKLSLNPSESQVWFDRAVQYCNRRFPAPTRAVSSPVVRFLYDWEAPLVSSPKVPKLTTLQRVVSEALKRGSDLASLDHALLCNLHVSSVVANQLCLTEPNHVAVECVLREPGTLLGWKLITKFVVVVERFAASNVVSTTAGLDPLHAPLESKGRCLWHGHVNGNDHVGLTRVFIRVLECEDFCPNSETAPPHLHHHSTFFSFNDHGQLAYSTRALPSASSSEIESISAVYATERCPAVLAFVLLSVHVTQARKFNLVYENQRRARLDKLGVFPSLFFSEYSLKLVGRDAHSPLELEIFLPLQGRVLPPGLTVTGSCWQLAGGTAMVMKSNKLYIAASNAAVLVPCQLRAATFPRDLVTLELDYLCRVRGSGAQKPWRGGGCVSLHLTKLLSAHLTHACVCVAAAATTRRCGMTKQCFALSCIAEVDDGSDQAQAFAENDVACALLGVAWSQVLARCGRHAARLKRLDFKQVAQCEPDSPQGEFRDLVGTRTSLAPLRAFVIRDSPFSAKSSASSFCYSAQGDDDDDDGKDKDFSKVAYVKTWDEAKVLTAVRPRLSLKLLAARRDELEAG